MNRPGVPTGIPQPKKRRPGNRMRRLNCQRGHKASRRKQGIFCPQKTTEATKKRLFAQLSSQDESPPTSTIGRPEDTADPSGRSRKPKVKVEGHYLLSDAARSFSSSSFSPPLDGQSGQTHNGPCQVHPIAHDTHMGGGGITFPRSSPHRLETPDLNQSPLHTRLHNPPFHPSR